MDGGRRRGSSSSPSVLTLVVAVVGFIVTVVLNAFVLDKYDAYGEVPIPGSSSLHLPAGEATVSFHTQTVGSPSGGGLPVPPLGLTITPPEGIPQPQSPRTRAPQRQSTTTSTSGSGWCRSPPRAPTTSPPTARSTATSTRGWRSGTTRQRLLAWVFGGLFVVGLLELTASIVYAVKSGKRRRPRPRSPGRSTSATRSAVRDPYRRPTTEFGSSS